MPTSSVPVAASTSAIPFGQAPAVPTGGSAMGFVVALILLTAAFVVLWFIRRRGYGRALPMSAITTGAGWSVSQRVRLTPTSQAIVLCDGDQRLVVVESRFGVQVTRIDTKEDTP